MNRTATRSTVLWFSVACAVGVGVVTTALWNRWPERRPDATARPPFRPDAVEGPPRGIVLTDVTEPSRIHFVHCDGGSGQKYLVEAVSAGLALFDYDGDGLIDIYFLNGAPLPPLTPDPAITNALFRNEGHGRFRDVTQEAGVGDDGFGLGVAVGDYDNDGYPDLYLNNFGPNVLYHNNGDGTFTVVTERAGVGCGERVGAGVCFLDADADGNLDLYVSNYVDFRFENHVRRTIDGYPCYPGPLDFEPAADFLYLNKGDGTFVDVSEASGVADVAGTGMGAVCADFDKDGDTDIVVVNDEHGNFLLENDGTGHFEETGLFRGLAFNYQGRPLGNMGVDCGDYDNDGWLDFFSTSYSQEPPALYRNLGNGLFDDVTLAAGAAAGSIPHVNWGTGFADFDNDGDRDLFIACGHLDQDVHRWNANTSFRVRNRLLENDGKGAFRDVTDQSGDGLNPIESSRGIGLDDLDNDGDIDVVVLNSRSRPNVLRNDTRTSNRWIEIRLIGTSSNRDGVGALVQLTAGGRTQWAEVHSGRGYQSHHGTRLHFGLGDAEQVERIEVHWIGGSVSRIGRVESGQCFPVVEK